MENIKNSIKKLKTTLIFRDLVQTQNNNINTSKDGDDGETTRIKNLEFIRRKYQKLIGNSVQYKSYEFPGDAVHKRVLENIEDLDIRDDDLFLITYPANGGHLLEDIVQSLVAKDLEKRSNPSKSPEDEEKIDDAVDGVDHQPPPESNKPNTTVPVARLEAANLYGHIRWLQSIKSPRIISSSLPYDLLPQQLQTPNNAKIIYMARNCKDHIVAYYYHHRLKGIQISLDDFVDLYLNGYLLYGNYFDHVLSYWQLSQLYQNNVLFICYEELKIITLTVAKMIAKFLSLDLNEKELEEIITNKQGRTNAINSDDLKQLSANNSPEESWNQTQKLNKFHNVLGDWDNYLDSNQIGKIDNMIRIKFDSQQLRLVENAQMALRNVQKFGRILQTENLGGDRRSKIFNNNNLEITNSLLSTLVPSKQRKLSGTAKKLKLTKNEALFLRKKDKVVIVEDDGSREEPESTSWSNKFLQYACCCCWGYFKQKKDYVQL